MFTFTANNNYSKGAGRQRPFSGFAPKLQEERCNLCCTCRIFSILRKQSKNGDFNVFTAEVKKETVRQAGQLCSYYLLNLRGVNSTMSFIDQHKDSLKLNNAFFSHVIEKYSHDAPEQLLSHSFYGRVLNAVVFSRHYYENKEVYYMTMKQPCEQMKPEITNVWTKPRGLALSGDNSIYSDSLLVDLSCRVFRAATFHYPLFTYITVKDDGTKEFTGTEVT